MNHRSALFVLLLLLMLGTSTAFYSPTLPTTKHSIVMRTWQDQHNKIVEDNNVLIIVMTRRSPGALCAAKKPEREKIEGLDLVLLYLTPWKNPNSIFVYMLLILYALGKYSESQ